MTDIFLNIRNSICNICITINGKLFSNIKNVFFNIYKGIFNIRKLFQILRILFFFLIFIY